jgi:hypothetical protein
VQGQIGVGAVSKDERISISVGTLKKSVRKARSASFDGGRVGNLFLVSIQAGYCAIFPVK